MALDLRLHGQVPKVENLESLLHEALTYAVYSEKDFADLLFQEELGVSLDLSFVDKKTIQSLNREHRQKDQATDVLSFPMLHMQEGKLLEELSFYHLENPELVEDEGEDAGFLTLLLGELVICEEVARAQAAEYGHSVLRELCFLAVHGTLHVLGYDHMEPEEDQRMQARQDAILSKVKVER